MLKALPVIWPVVAGLAAALFSWVQYATSSQEAEYRYRFELIKYYFDNKDLFDPCKPSFDANIETLIKANPELRDTFLNHALVTQGFRCRDPEQRRDALQSIATLAGEKAIETPEPVVEESRARYTVFLHYPEGATGKKQEAEEVEARLREAGFSVAGIEGVPNVPSRNELRVYSSLQMAAGEKIADAAGTVLDGPVATVDISKTYRRLPANYFELWIAR